MTYKNRKSYAYRKKKKVARKPRNYKQKYSQYGGKLKINRPVMNALGNQVGMNLIKDYQFFIDPKKTSDTTAGLQKSVVIRFNVNSIYPAQSSGGDDTHFIQRTPNATCNPAETIVPYYTDAPNPGEADHVQGIYNQGDYSIGRKYEHAYITGAKLTVKAEAVCGASAQQPLQPGIISLITHNSPTNPASIDTDVQDLKFILDRKSRRINGATLTTNVGDSTQSLAGTKSKYVKLSMGVNIAKQNNLRDIADNKNSFAFSLGSATSTGSTPTATTPAEKNYISFVYTPAMVPEMLGLNVQQPPIIVRFRLQQRLIAYERRSHSQVAGVNYNLPRPFALPDPSTGS